MDTFYKMFLCVKGNMDEDLIPPGSQILFENTLRTLFRVVSLFMMGSSILKISCMSLWVCSLLFSRANIFISLTQFWNGDGFAKHCSEKTDRSELVLVSAAIKDPSVLLCVCKVDVECRLLIVLWNCWPFVFGSISTLLFSPDPNSK